MKVCGRKNGSLGWNGAAAKCTHHCAVYCLGRRGQREQGVIQGGKTKACILNIYFNFLLIFLTEAVVWKTRRLYRLYLDSEIQVLGEEFCLCSGTPLTSRFQF